MSTESHRSLSEVHGSVPVPQTRGRWRRLLAFLGPAYLVSVGYMDPGNWATDIAGGSAFGYRLIWVLLMSNLMALLLQSLSARLGIVRGLDLAQASRHTYPPFINIPLYVLAEIAIAACDLAEVIGMAIGMNLLFGLPVLYGVLITALDSLLILFLMQKGMRVLEVFIISLVTIIGLAFLTEIMIVKPEMSQVAKGFIPSELSGDALYIAIGIIGATVMPHNLYLHSALVQTRRIEPTERGLRQALRFNLLDTGVALNIAFLVNAAILVLAAAAFHTRGLTQVAEIEDAHQLLHGLFGSLAPALFAIALIGAGQSSTITGTLAGQIVMEGYLNLRIRPWLRRLLTRLIAIVPAVVSILAFGDGSLSALLVLSQVVLSLQLGFAIVPLIHFCSDKAEMKGFAIGAWVRVLAWAVAGGIIVLNAKLVVEEISGWLELGGSVALLVKAMVIPIASGFALLLLYITFAPWLTRRFREPRLMHEGLPELQGAGQARYATVCITVDFSKHDSGTISAALAHGGTDATYVLIHIVESAVARYLGAQSLDHESKSDQGNLDSYAERLRSMGYRVETRLGHGGPIRAIAEIVNTSRADLLVMGAHGHRGLKDIVLGATVDAVRHRVNVPVLIVQ